MSVFDIRVGSVIFHFLGAVIDWSYQVYVLLVYSTSRESVWVQYVAFLGILLKADQHGRPSPTPGRSGSISGSLANRNLRSHTYIPSVQSPTPCDPSSPTRMNAVHLHHVHHHAQNASPD